jgi:two-component system, NarL family, response regulator NreC
LSTADEAIRLVLIDQYAMFREGLAALIGLTDGLEVVGQAESVAEYETLGVEADVVVTGIVFPDATPDEVVDRLRSLLPDTAIIVLSRIDDLATVQQVLAAGADGYLLKTAAPSELLAGIHAVARGDMYLQPAIGIAFASHASSQLAETGVDVLTAKETEVLRLLALGHTSAEIADTLGASLRTIETHRAHVYQKLDCHTRAELVRYALDAGLLRLDDDGAATPDRRIADRQTGDVSG